MRFNFRRQEMELRRSCYDNNQNALLAINPLTDKQSTLTIELVNSDLRGNEFAIKPELEDLAEVVFNTGLFEDTRKRLVLEDNKGTVEVWEMREPNRLSDIPAVT